jgi:hypothetical protein
VLVRFKTGVVGEIQIWQPHLLALKEGSEFVEDSFPKHLKEYVSDITVPAAKDSGHALYKKRPLKKEDPIKYDKVEKEMFELYKSGESSANISWKSALESSRPLDSMSPSSKGRKGLPASGENQPSTASSDRVITAGRQSSEKKRTAVVKSNNAIDKSSNDIITKDKDLIELNEIKVQEAQKLIDDLGDDLQMVSGVKDSGKGDAVLEFKTAKEVFEEIDNEQKLVDDLLKCVGS